MGSVAEEVQLRTLRPIGRQRGSLNRSQSRHGVHVPTLLPLCPPAHLKLWLTYGTVGNIMSITT
jgi:hypothetical protein